MMIRIRDEFKEDYISRVAGERLRNRVLEAVAKGEKITLDFTGITIASTSFFDEGFAKLADCGWTRPTFDAAITFIGLHPLDKRVLDEMCRNRGLT
jgi:hypothetical protein